MAGKTAKGVYMGKIVKQMAFIPFLVIMLVVGCGSSPKTEVLSGEGQSLDAAIREAAAQMETNLPGQTKVALVSIASSSVQFSEYVISRLEAALVDGKKLVVVDRANLDRIREEQGFQLSGEVSDESAKVIGQLLGAGAIVTGSFTDLGDVYSLTLKAINMETAAVAVSYPADIARSTRIQTMLASGGGAAGTQKARAGSTDGNTRAQVPAEPVPSYEIGDIGPAGGIVFFDMGFVMDGWRYLEAAPQDFPTKAKWSTHWNLARMETGVGTGAQNTASIVSLLKKNGENMRAAQVISVPEYGGYADWFLPSKDELNLMYENLKKQRIGGFSNEIYWSSSSTNIRVENWRNGVWQMNFADGNQNNAHFNNEGLVRAVRRF
jgi:hypothetical protein